MQGTMVTAMPSLQRAPVDDAVDARRNIHQHDRQRELVLIGQEDEGSEEFVPGIQEGEHRNGGDTGKRDRQHDPAQDRRLRSTVNPRRFDQRLRHRVEGVAHHENGKRKLEGHIDQHQAEKAVLQPEDFQDQEKRRQDRLERNHHRRHDQHEEQRLTGKAEFRKAVSRLAPRRAPSGSPFRQRSAPNCLSIDVPAKRRHVRGGGNFRARRLSRKALPDRQVLRPRA